MAYTNEIKSLGAMFGPRKVSEPVKADGSWRIHRHDGEVVGWFATKALAQAEIERKPWFR